MATPFDFAAMLQAFGAMQQQQQRGALGAQREALGQNNKLGRYGGRVDPMTGVDPNDPFANGFFKSAGERSAVEASRGPMPTSTDSNPYFQQWQQAFLAPAPTTAPLPFTLEGAAAPGPVNPSTGMFNPADAFAQLDRLMKLRGRGVQAPRMF